MIRYRCAVCLAVVFVLTGFTGSLFASTIHVPTAQFPTIQLALDDANEGDTVIVDPCTYYENIVFPPHAVTLTSTDPCDPNIVAATIIDGSLPDDANFASTVTFNAGQGNDSILTGFTITGGSGTWLSVAWQYQGLKWNRCGGGIVCYNGAEPTITRNLIRDNVSAQGGGFYIYGDPVNPDAVADPPVHLAPIISYNTFTNNTATTDHGYIPPDPNSINDDHGDGGAIVAFQACDPIVTNNIFDDNFGRWYGGALHYRQWCNGQLYHNEFTNNTSTLGAGLHLTYRSSPDIRYNLVQGGTSGNLGGAGIYVYFHSHPFISHNIIADNSSGNGSGMSVNWSSSPTITNNLFIRNLGSRGAIKCTGGEAVITFNTFVDNYSNSSGAGISALHSASPTIENNLIADSTGAPAIFVMDTPEYPADPIIRHNNLYNNSYGNYGGDIVDQTGLNGNISQPPALLDPDNDNYDLDWASHCINAGDPNFDDNQLTDLAGRPRQVGQFVDIGAYEAYPVWNTTSDLKYSQIQTAIDDACDGDTVVVTPATYFENLKFKGRNIHLTSANPHDWDIVAQTVIDGSDTDTVVLFEDGEDANCVLTGFTITNGMPVGDYGGGIRIRNYSGPTILNNRVTGNTAKKGAGICLYHSFSQVRDNLIFGNKTTAIGQGGGVMLIDCIEEPNAILANNLIVGNTALYGGGISIQQSDAIITNNTIAYNRGTWKGIGVYAEGDLLTNCILWGHGGLPDDDLYDAVAEYSCTESNAPGVGNIATDPCFAQIGYWDDDGTPDPADDFFVLGNYHLLPASSCIDAGSDLLVPVSLSLDIDREDRIVDAAVDMGFDEVFRPAADINLDGVVDYLDFLLLVQFWLDPTPGSPYDLTNDNLVNLEDFDYLELWWLWQAPWLP